MSITTALTVLVWAFILATIPSQPSPGTAMAWMGFYTIASLALGAELMRLFVVKSAPTQQDLLAVISHARNNCPEDVDEDEYIAECIDDFVR